ncbi:octanoyltransferase LipM [Desulfosporosinus acididurans]|uniref:Octanoyltransferase LipM n=1 Tax=Desulfosporosinus acididurans TaxID=476652 RepID=A0A0J1FPT0_9FIRM|nr:lipoate--protein ligase family protein [Desulfosporosinus acididurans]KLU64958.1 octanoyltransferase LipM [Desulfosporosinus acididurans]
MDLWRYLPYAAASGAENMAIDEALLLMMVQATDPQPVLRFYGWNPAALSLGYAQSYEREVDERACQAEGIDIVRRPTGGRAVLHQYELTYSVIAPEKDPNVSGTVTESYLKISKALLSGFQALGIPAEMSVGGVAKETTTAACFDAPSWYELVVNGRKLVGSAQMRKEGMLLQHGSILLHFDADLLFRLLKFPNAELRERLLQRFKKKACALDEIWPQPIGREELEREICRGFCRVMEIDLIQSQLTDTERYLMQEILRSKYRSDTWNKKR